MHRGLCQSNYWGWNQVPAPIPVFMHHACCIFSNLPQIYYKLKSIKWHKLDLETRSNLFGVGTTRIRLTSTTFSFSKANRWLCAKELRDTPCQDLGGLSLQVSIKLWCLQCRNSFACKAAKINSQQIQFCRKSSLSHLRKKWSFMFFGFSLTFSILSHWQEFTTPFIRTDKTLKVVTAICN